MNGGSGGGGTEKSEWRQMFLYTRCVCFGCTGKDPQMTGFAGDDNGSTSSSMQDNNSLHRQKEKTKLTTRFPALDGVSVIARRRRRHSLLPPSSSRRHGDMEEEEEEEEEEERVSSSSGVVVATTAVHRTSRLHQMNHLSLLSASKDLRVLLDQQYLTQASRILNSAKQWSFNIFTLNKLTNGCSLFYMTLHLFHHYDFLRVFRLDVTRLMRCITLIESSYYFSNPYHNSVHAADVVQAMFCHLNEPQLADCLKPLEKMAALLSAACHDVDHPGTNQGFLIATAHPLCSLYNNMSILENHHWRATIGILHESKLFEHLDQQTWQTMKHLIQTMILATDITRQTEILSVFQEHLDKKSLNLSSSEQHRSFILQITLKCADISNPCRPWHLSKCWSELICEEFYKQGDCERGLGLPVTSFCDRSQSTMANIQTGFMTHVAEPLFVEWNRFTATSNSKTLLDNLQHNRGQWESIALQENSALSAAKITVQAVTERNSGNPEQTTTQVNGENLASGTRADPSLANEDLDSSEVEGSWQRRNSLPGGTSIRMSTGRRLSLPNGYPNVLSVFSRLACLSESSHASEDACNTVKKSKIRRCSFDDVTPEKTMCYYSERHQMNHQTSPEYTANSRNLRKLCIGLDNICSLQRDKLDFCTNIGHTMGNRLDDAAMPNGCQPNSEHRCSSRSSRWQAARKMSLIAPRDQKMMAVIVGRKRSRSLATSTLVCTFENNLSAAAPQSFETNLNGLVPAEQMVDTSSRSRWMAWWHKKTKNHFCATKIPPGPHNSDAYHCHPTGDSNGVEDVLPLTAAASSSVGISRAMPPVQLLSCQCPVLVTHLNSHCCSAKGSCSGSSSVVSRKPTSVFTSSPATEDAEAMPLLASDSSCIWHNEM